MVLYHHGIKGMHWGIRRFQNKDGSLTAEGIKRYRTDLNFKYKYDKYKAKQDAKAAEKAKQKEIKRVNKLMKKNSRKLTAEELEERINRLAMETRIADLERGLDTSKPSNKNNQGNNQGNNNQGKDKVVGFGKKLAGDIITNTGNVVAKGIAGYVGAKILKGMFGDNNNTDNNNTDNSKNKNNTDNSKNKNNKDNTSNSKNKNNKDEDPNKILDRVKDIVNKEPENITSIDKIVHPTKDKYSYEELVGFDPASNSMPSNFSLSSANKFNIYKTGPKRGKYDYLIDMAHPATVPNGTGRYSDAAWSDELIGVSGGMINPNRDDHMSNSELAAHLAIEKIISQYGDRKV